MQALAITAESRPTKRFTLATSSALSVTLIFVESTYRQNWLEILTSLSTLVALLSLQRRPVVFHQGHAVDQEYGVSALERYSFSWASDVFSLAKVGLLSIRNLPSLGHHMRIRTLKTQYAADDSPKLWVQLVRTFGYRIVQQWVLIALKALCSFGSRFAIYQLLRTLELGKSPAHGTAQDESAISVASFWALVLGLSLIMDSVVGTRLAWLTETRLAIPVTALLNALIFEKSTRVQTSHKAPAADGSLKSKKTNTGASQSLTSMMANDR